MSKMVEEAERLGIRAIGLPRIGAGLGGLPWAWVWVSLARIGAEARVHLYVFEHWVRSTETPGPDQRVSQPELRHRNRD